MNTNTKTGWQSLLLAIALSTAPLLSLLIAGNFPVYTRGEGREGLVVKAILQDNNFVLPLRNGLDIPSKPPLFHWCGALMTKLGIFSQELSLRLPSAIFGALIGISIFVFLRRRYGDLFALSTTAMTVGSFEWMRTAQSARVDMTFYTALIGALLFLYTLFEEHSHKLKTSIFAGVCIGIAILGKGPAGLVIPLAIAGAFSILSLRRFKRTVFYLALSGVVGAIIGASWYFAAYKVGGDRFIEVQLLKENLARISNQGDYELGHESGPLSIIGLLLVGTLPFSILLLPFAVYAWKLRKIIFKRPDPFFVFCLIWLAVFLLVFGVSSSKRGVYLVGCFPAAAYLLNRLIERILMANENAEIYFRRTIIWIFALSAIICTKAWLVALFAKDFVLEHIKKEGPRLLTASILHNSYLLAAVGALVLLLWLLTFDQSRRNFAGGLLAMSAFAAVISVFSGTFVLPIVATQQSPKQFMADIAPLLNQSSLNFQEDSFFAANYYASTQLLPFRLYSELKQGQTALILRSKTSPFKLPPDIQFGEIVAESPTLDVQGRDKLILQRISR